MLFLLLAILVGLLGLWLWNAASSDPGELSSDGLGVGPSSGELSSAVGEPAAPDGVERTDLGQAPSTHPGPGAAILAADGNGSIRGRLVVDPGVPFPERWTVVVAPSRRAFGSSPAEHRSVPYTGDTAEFVVPDLPLGGYEVWVEAPGMNSKRSVALLNKVSAHPYLVVTVSPTGFIDGYVIGGDSLPAEGIRVTLERRENQERVETRTRPDGLYCFDAVKDGEYRLILGPPEKPLVPVRELSFEAPSMRFPNIELPKTVEVLIHTRDHLRSRLPGVTVTGFGNNGGRIDLVSDSLGEGRATNLPPGRYRVQAHTDDGRRAHGTFMVKEIPGQEFFLFLR